MNRITEHFLYKRYKKLLASHDFCWRATEDPRFINRYLDEEHEIEILRVQVDRNNELYNQYSPWPKT